MTTYYKSVSIDFSSVLNGLKSKLNELKSMSIHSNLSSSQIIGIKLNKSFLRYGYQITLASNLYKNFQRGDPYIYIEEN